MKIQYLLAASLLVPGVAFGGASLVIPVSADESVCSIAPDRNYALNTNRGGLFVGSDGVGIARFYLRFDIPDFIKASSIVSASLVATYFDDLDRADNGLIRVHFVADDTWTEEEITWDNQPGPSFGTPEATFDASKARVGDTVRLDVSGIVGEQVAAGDRAISFMFAAANEGANSDNRNWEYFAEREFDPDKSFRLSLQTTARVGTGGGDAVPVPLPPAAWPAVITLAGAGAVALRRRLRRG